MFAGLYPNEVAGLVFVDSKDFTPTRAEQLAVWTELGPGEAGMNAQEKAMEQQFAGSAPAVRAEAEVALQLDRSGWEDFRSLPSLSHYIQSSEPELVVWAIRRTLDPSR
jgi:hypothetical protein